ncbi:MAG: 2-amino-4-hydroxy-6-hydroxymethyldihydropteridine diphosphokinase [Bacteroidales bacterium]|nr:2-amino-4-hydroxy-6-hydroxymethyldihydropteridine diphosphokinase [Bacteroidales bacterium]MBR3413192.1 2-amino-4-hydroxy-6-hydroxymethyldihydropteridine diphosphokinase [Bacteroidales bacterium]
MPTLYLLIGGNQGDRQQMLSHATDLIRERIGSVVAVSNIYETAPWGMFAPGEEPQNFYNKALQVETTLSPHEALGEALGIERILGRRRENGSVENARYYSSRPIDIDLIFYDTMVIDAPDLVLPHPRMHLRRFVLQPLCQLAPDFIHPVFNKSLSQLLEECPDTSSCLCCC